MSRLCDIGEFGLIELLRKRILHLRGLKSRQRVIQGIGDDAAVVPFTSDRYLLFTTDMIVEGVHFTLKDAPEAIGRKALACNISDIAAMGGVPTYAVVSLGISPQARVQWTQKIYQGMEKLTRSFAVAIVGGDTAKSNRLIINVALLGEVKKTQMVTRAGARRGDWIFITGPLGGSLRSGRHLTFTPRIKESQFLVKNFKPTAMIDISDGLATDLGHILEESHVGAVLYEHKIPLNRGATLRQALYDGEDFELLFTLPPDEAKRLQACKKDFYFIGEIVSSRYGLQCIDRSWKKKKLTPQGFQHF